MVKQAACYHFFFNDGGSDSDDGNHGDDGPTVISDVGLITHIRFAALPKFYTDNSSIIQKLIYDY
jgi:hypothetical protein